MKTKLAAVRTVSETDDIRTIEGLAFPFKGRDTYGTFFSARTDFHWDLYPDVSPAAVRAVDDAKFIRPNTFHHGFDPDIGLARVGGWSPIRMDADGVWVRAQIDKRNTYYENRLKPLLDAGALGLSGGSAEHSVRIDNRSGEVLDWPAYELALTPVEANPLAQIATRSADTGASLRIVAALADRPLDAVLEAPATSPATPPASRGPNALRYSSAAWDASAAAWTLASLIDLLGEEAAESEQAGFLRTAIAALQQFIEAEQAEIGTPADVAESAADQMLVEETISVTAWASGVRARQQSTTKPPATAGDTGATAPAADGQPTLRIIAAAVRSDVDDKRELAAIAERAAAAAVARLTGPPAS
jgi:hypothetical protein